MISLSIFKFFLTFIVGSLWVIFVTFLAERYGTKIGGVIAGLPSTSLLTFFFIGLLQNTDLASQATTIVPFMMGAISLLVVTYIYLARYNFFLGLGAGVLVWLFLSFIAVFFQINNLLISFLVLILCFCFFYYMIHYRFHVSSLKGKKMSYSFSMVLFRGILAGSVISLGVLMTSLLGPIYGGIFASFPALFISTNIITYFAHGYEFTVAIMKVSVISSAITMPIYAMGVRYFYPLLGVWYGTLLSIVVVLLVGYGLHNYVQKYID